MAGALWLAFGYCLLTVARIARRGAPCEFLRCAHCRRRNRHCVWCLPCWAVSFSKNRQFQPQCLQSIVVQIVYCHVLRLFAMCGNHALSLAQAGQSKVRSKLVVDWTKRVKLSAHCLMDVNTCRFALWNVPFCTLKRHVLPAKTGLFANALLLFPNTLTVRWLAHRRFCSSFRGDILILFWFYRQTFIVVISTAIVCLQAWMGWLRCESACETERTDIQPKSQFGFWIYAFTLQCKQISAIALCVAALAHTPQQAASHGDVAGVCERGFCFRC